MATSLLATAGGGGGGGDFGDLRGWLSLELTYIETIVDLLVGRISYLQLDSVESLLQYAMPESRVKFESRETFHLKYSSSKI